MSTFMLKTKHNPITTVSNTFIDNYMPKARGEYVKVYLLGLKCCQCGEPGITSSMIADTLNLLETDVLNAWKYWDSVGVVEFTGMDTSNSNFQINFIDIDTLPKEAPTKVTHKEAITDAVDSKVKDMFTDIEQILGRPLSPSELTAYLSWKNEYNFSPELISMLVNYSVSKGKSDYRYMEKIAMNWHDKGISTVDDAQAFIKQYEGEQVNVNKIAKYMGLKFEDISEAHRDMISTWLNVYKFSADIIKKAISISVENLNKVEPKYINSILNSWFKKNVKSIEDIERLEKPKTPKTQSVKQGSAKKPYSSFTDFKQREYDFEELEKKLLGWDSDD